jgi:hypothetical protein
MPTSSLRRLLLALPVFSLAAGASGAGPDCNADPDACVRQVIAETAVFMHACGDAFPDSRAVFDTALRNWSVLKLSIPRLNEALAPDAPLQASLRDTEKAIECSGRLEMVRSAVPTLSGDSARLPPDALARYATQQRAQ